MNMVSNTLYRISFDLKFEDAVDNAVRVRLKKIYIYYRICYHILILSLFNLFLKLIENW